MAPKPWIVPFPGTTKLHLFVENLGAVTSSFDDDLQKIEQALNKIDIRRHR